MKISIWEITLVILVFLIISFLVKCIKKKKIINNLIVMRENRR